MNQIIRKISFYLVLWVFNLIYTISCIRLKTFGIERKNNKKSKKIFVDFKADFRYNVTLQGYVVKGGLIC